MREQAYLRGIWTDLIPQETTPFYQRFAVESCQRGTCVGEVDSRQLYPDVYQIGIRIDKDQMSGVGMDASLAVITWLFDFRRARAVVIASRGEGGPLSGLFEHGLVVETARSPQYQIVNGEPQDLRWGILRKSDFEQNNVVLNELRKRYSRDEH